MRRRGLLAGLLLGGVLAACAPLLATPDPAPPQPLTDPTPAVLRLTAAAKCSLPEPEGHLTPTRVCFDAGASAATLSKLTLIGAGLRVSDGRCKADGLDIVCSFGAGLDVPGGKSFGLPQSGTAHGVAEYMRGGLGLYTARF